MILNFLSYARGDFYVKTARTGLRDLLVIIPLTAERGSSGIIAESSSGSAMPLWIMVNHGCHNGAHSNGCPAQSTSPFNTPESPSGACVSQMAGESRFPVEEFRARMISAYHNSPSNLFSSLWSPGHSMMKPVNLLVLEPWVSWLPSAACIVPETPHPNPWVYGMLDLERPYCFQEKRWWNYMLLLAFLKKICVLCSLSQSSLLASAFKHSMAIVLFSENIKCQGTKPYRLVGDRTKWQRASRPGKKYIWAGFLCCLLFISVHCIHVDPCTFVSVWQSLFLIREGSF